MRIIWNLLSRYNEVSSFGITGIQVVTGENQGGYWALSHAFISGRIGLSGQGMIYHWQEKLFEDSNIDGGNIAETQKLNPNATISLGLPPKGPYGQGTFANNDIQSNKIFVFNKDLENEPDKFAKLIQMFDWSYETYDYFGTMMYGIKGEDWQLTEKMALDGQKDVSVSFIGDFADGKLRSANFAQAFNIFSPSWPEIFVTAQERWKAKVQTADYRVMNQLMVSLDSDAQYKADLEKLVVETYFAIILGEKPLSEFDTFVDTWFKAGGEQLTKEANAWYDTVK